MGMYDRFYLKVPIQCRNCYTGAFYEFQTKELDRLLDTFIEGELAATYAWREITEDEKKRRHEDFMLLHPILAGTPWEEMSGMFRTDKSQIIKRLPDGIYWTYTWCHACESMMDVPMEVKNGIFVGVAKNE
jgi:hypothetical protein